MKNEDDPPEDAYKPLSNQKPIVLGDISSRLIRQWIAEGKADYERQQREQSVTRDIPQDETPSEEPE